MPYAQVHYPFENGLGDLPDQAKFDCLKGYVDAWHLRHMDGTSAPEDFHRWVRWRFGEGIAQRASDIDVVYNHGYGYPRWRGGPMFYASTVGLPKIAERLAEWSDGSSGQHWNPSDLLMTLAEEGKDFSDYDRENT